MTSKQLKDLETKLHDKLYDNIKLLTYEYPTTKEFDSVFVRNMFSKSNKAAFQHVIYYLFTIFSPELTKEKITWPLYDIKMESTFRTEVIGFVNYINNNYGHADIPNLMSSHLMAPGGLKFIKFMFKLSIFVLYEHLKRDPEISSELLAPIRVHKDSKITNIIQKTLKTKTALEERKTKEMMHDFEAFFVNSNKTAEEIVLKQSEVENELIEAKQLLKDESCKIEKLGITPQSIEDQVNSLQDKVKSMENIKLLCQRGAELLTHLSSDEPHLDFKKSEFIVPDNVKHLFRSGNDSLDLNNLFYSLSVLLENESLEMPVFTEDQLHEMTKLVSDLNDKYAQLKSKLSSHKNELDELSENSLLEINRNSKIEKLPDVIVTEYN